MTEPLLQIKGLKKYFPITSGILRKQIGSIKAVDGVDFSLKSGEVLGLVGETGSGKSTTGRAAIRLIEPTAGEIYFMGKNFLNLKDKELIEMRKHVQMVFQDPFSSLNPRKTVAENIGEALFYHKMVDTRSQQIEKVGEILKKIGLPPESMHRYPHQFSGGQ